METGVSKTKVYAGRAKDRNVLENSSSGGMMTVLTDYILRNNGVVVCAVYQYAEKQVTYSIIKTAEERDTARGSKYVQSIMGNIFVQAEEWLKENPDKELLFIGMGCQAAAFQKYMKMKKLDSRVYIVDIICHGSPSPLLWETYANMLEEKYCSSITNLTFKDKRYGWNKPTAVVTIKGKEVFLDEYVKIFYSKMVLRPSCYSCPYAKVERTTDMTIGDYWGIEKVMPDFYDSLGNSLILLHSEKGKHLFEQIKNDLEYSESNTKDCLQPNLMKPTEKPEKRDVFWSDYKKKGICYVSKKYGKDSLKIQMKKKMKRILHRLKIKNSKMLSA